MPVRSIVKPLPSDLFVVHDTNAEMRWEAMSGMGHHVPNDRFFVRNHTSTPRIDARTWRPARLYGPGAGWQAWELPWRPARPGPAVLMARATDGAGNT